MQKTDSKIIVALDMANETEVLTLTEQLNPQQCRLKVGKALFVSCGTQIVKRLIKDGFDVFLDLKFHDIPNTVTNACLAAQALGAWMVNVHCLGGRRMLESVANAYANIQGDKPLLIAVTLLTSMQQQDLTDIGINTPLGEQAMLLAALAKDTGMDGVVCSGHEVTSIKQQLGSNFLCVTPGIRLPDNSHDDQRRIMTPQQAIRAGSDYLVIGRAITTANNPSMVCEKINVDINK